MRVSLHVDATPEEVFAALADGPRYADWVVGTKEIRDADDAFPAVGSTLHHSLGIGPVTLHDTVEVVRNEPPGRLELDARGGPLRAAVRFALEPDPDGTMVVMEEEATNALSRRLVRVTRPQLAARNAETLWRLRAQVENRGDVGRPAPPSTGSDVPRWLGDLTARLFGLGAALRGERAFHPKGITRMGTVTVTDAAAALTEAATGPVVHALVRLSRGVGLPSRLPDVNGLAVRLIDARGRGRHRDLLFASSSTKAPWALVPATDFARGVFSSILPFVMSGQRVRLLAEISPGPLTYDRLSDPNEIDIRISARVGHSSIPLLGITATELIDGTEIHFNPVATGERLTATGFLNALRAPAYAASQAVRRHPTAHRGGKASRG